VSGSCNKLDVALTIDSVTTLKRSESIVVVIDVLRATSTIARALASGARNIYPAAGVEAARELALELGDALLCGERMGVMPEGFDLGNSPLEYTEEKVSGRDLVLATTNGTKALEIHSDALELYAASLLNAKAVAEKLIVSGKDVILVCAGQDGAFGAEDAICAGLIAEKIKGACAELTDPAWAAMTLYRACKHDIPGSIKQCDHAVYLVKEGFGEDVSYCSKVDEFDVVPVAFELNGRKAIRSFKV